MPWQSRDGIAPTIAGMLFNTLSPYNDATGTFNQGLAREWFFLDKEGNPLTLPDGSIDFDRLEEVYGDSPQDYIPVRFTLFEDATWSDGTRVTVEDVFFSFDLAANHSLSNHAGALVWVNDLLHKYENGVLIRQGMFTYDRGAAEAGYIISEEERDTVIYFHVNQSLGGMMTLVSTVLVLPKHLMDGLMTSESPLINRDPTEEQTEAFENPVGSGPFVLDRDNTNAQRIVLNRRDEYHIRGENGGHLFQPERIVFYLYQDVNIAIFALKKGHIDLLSSSISSNFINLFDNNPDIEVMQADGVFVNTLVLNVNPPSNYMTPFRELLTKHDFRRAIALAISQEELIEHVLNGAGVTYSQGLVDVRQPFYNPDANIIEGGSDADIAEANMLLDAIAPERDSDGYRLWQGNKILFEIFGSPEAQTLIAFLQVQLQRIGIDVMWRPFGPTPENTFLFPGNFDMTLQGVSLTQANINTMLPAHFINLGRSSNYGSLINYDLQEIADGMQSTLNQNEQFSLAKDAQLVIANEFYKIPLYSADVISVFRTDRFSNFQTVSGSGAFNNTSLQSVVFYRGEGS
jgi:ABC-type transport system substrate-binding protein